MSSIKYDRLYSSSDGRSRVQKNLEIELAFRGSRSIREPRSLQRACPFGKILFSAKRCNECEAGDV